jgi:hypothetical protein
MSHWHSIILFFRDSHLPTALMPLIFQQRTFQSFIKRGLFMVTKQKNNKGTSMHSKGAKKGNNQVYYIDIHAHKAEKKPSTKDNYLTSL